MPGAARLPVIRGVEGTLGVVGVDGTRSFEAGICSVGVLGGGISSSILAPPELRDPPMGPPRLFLAFFFWSAAANTVVPVKILSDAVGVLGPGDVGREDTVDVASDTCRLTQ